MKTISTTILTLIALVAAATAGTYKVPKKEPIASIAFPDKWKITEEDEILEATTADEDIYIAIEFHKAEAIQEAVEQTFVYLAEHKVKIDKASQKKQEADVKGIHVINYDWNGEDADGKCKISLSVLAVTETKVLLMLYWASPEAEKKHEKELGLIQESIAKLAK